MGFLADPLSAMMLLVVTGVGFLIHIYSIGYMHGDPGYYRFFAYPNLFMFFMLVLITGNNYLVMFVGWEGVGLSSYLLIGFWFERKSAADAGKKAFVVNRVGDAGFLLGVFLIYTTTAPSPTWTSSNVRLKPARRSSPPSPSACSWGQWGNRPRFRSTSGCPMPWKVRHR